MDAVDPVSAEMNCTSGKVKDRTVINIQNKTVTTICLFQEKGLFLKNRILIDSRVTKMNIGIETMAINVKTNLAMMIVIPFFEYPTMMSPGVFSPKVKKPNMDARMYIQLQLVKVPTLIVDIDFTDAFFKSLITFTETIWTLSAKMKIGNTVTNFKKSKLKA
ncbi:hypothetical protein M0812_02382 [Anaeramoeba flamelloides]|uniref:Uncharacterized protein n=1 Tax=Anaeramoeba flamelloides TaxID=1746091 RepID=A0AAV7Z2S2_9EUKA|nr:hypothetical protein M0812_02382 [Anaeramoeba flamelloides]